jgi:hypothetical protein
VIPQREQHRSDAEQRNEDVEHRYPRLDEVQEIEGEQAGRERSRGSMTEQSARQKE